MPEATATKGAETETKGPSTIRLAVAATPRVQRNGAWTNVARPVPGAVVDELRAAIKAAGDQNDGFEPRQFKDAGGPVVRIRTKDRAVIVSMHMPHESRAQLNGGSISEKALAAILAAVA